MKNIFKILFFHSHYTIKQFYYIFKISFTNKNLFLTSLNLSLKFLYYNGLKNFFNKKIYSKYKYDYLELVKKNLILSNDWFSNNITTWVSVFKKENIIQKKLNILEIGSYEGASAVFFLNYFNYANLTCIETFNGSDEHQSIDFSKVKKNFHHNINNFVDRINLFESRSENFFNEENNKTKYDIIYIDGSHYFDDVCKDAENSFLSLKDNGIIIFDDFLKKYYKDLKKDPIVAIIKFIDKHKKNIRIINVNYQIIIKKIK